MKRSRFVNDILSILPIIPFTTETAWIAGRIRGEQAAIGNTLPIADSFIAATALQLNYSLITNNAKDFIRIPGLKVLPFALT